MPTIYPRACALFGVLSLFSFMPAEAQTPAKDVDAAGNTIIDSFDSYDLNRDGFLQPDEHRAESSLSFESMDVNRDNLSSKEEYCNELSRQSDALSGKPLRHTSARNRFDLECGDGDRDPIGILPANRSDPDFN